MLWYGEASSAGWREFVSGAGKPLRSPSKKSRPFVLGSKTSLSDLVSVCFSGRPVALSPEIRKRLQNGRQALLKAAAGGKAVYGVNTGFGELASRRIPETQLKILQRNLVLSHACGVGEPLSPKEARAILFLRANELARGRSGVRPAVVELMAGLLNAGVAPLIPSRGSVGASGDLAPQAHMALLLLGRGEALSQGKRIPAATALKLAHAAPLDLGAKEGLALLNGTQAMQAVGGLALHQAFRVFRAVQLAGAMSLEAMTGTPAPFNEGLQRLKPHPGQIEAARELRTLLEESAIRESHRENDPRVQDPYSLRCMPQVHGAALDLLNQALRTLEIELQSVTDNPLLVDGRAVSGGNFHGQALSFAFDMAGIALTTLGNISERRIFQLISGQAPKLTPFLARNPGLESGWMIAQVAAAALASENKVLAHPASVDSIPTSANKEDFVSMGMGAALKLKRIAWNAAQIAGIEMLCAAQGVEAHAPLVPGRGVARGLELLRREIKPNRGDEVLSGKMERARELVLAGGFDP
ncbi:MAG: histidine ammonia-lyase [Elusimicrobia bacterium]|nr:histidine ammonia-lyase [Elusimicrobiota bacterium]